MKRIIKQKENPKNKNNSVFRRAQSAGVCGTSLLGTEWRLKTGTFNIFHGKISLYKNLKNCYVIYNIIFLNVGRAHCLMKGSDFSISGKFQYISRKHFLFRYSPSSVIKIFQRFSALYKWNWVLMKGTPKNISKG